MLIAVSADVSVVSATAGNAGNTGFYINATETLNFATIYGGTGSVSTGLIVDADVTFTRNGPTTTFTSADNAVTLTLPHQPAILR